MPPKYTYRGRRASEHSNDPSNSAPVSPELPTSPSEPLTSQSTAWDISPSRAEAWDAIPTRATSQQSHPSRGNAQPRRGSATSSRGSHRHNPHNSNLRAQAPLWQPSASRALGNPRQTSHPPAASESTAEPYPNISHPPLPDMPPSEPSSSSRRPHQVPNPIIPEPSPPKKKKNKNKKQRKRRQSFAAPSDTTEDPANPLGDGANLKSVPEEQAAAAHYRLGNQDMDSDSSLDSEALLDHRGQNPNPTSRIRRLSSPQHQSIPSRPPQLSSARTFPQSSKIPAGDSRISTTLQSSVATADNSDDSDDGDGLVSEQPLRSERTPLISRNRSSRNKSRTKSYGIENTGIVQPSRRRRKSPASSASSRRRNPTRMSSPSSREEYDINNPPSRPGSPRAGIERDFEDVLLHDYSDHDESHRFRPSSQGRDAVINIDYDQDLNTLPGAQSPPTAGFQASIRRRATEVSSVEDVCIPFEHLTEIGEEDDSLQHQDGVARRRHRKRAWPDLSALEEWSQFEKEERSQEGVRAKKVDEPVVIGGRLRPQKGTWRREAEDAPFRWTYFNEEMDTSLRSHSISGLQQLGNSFKELFIPDRPEIDDSSSDEDEGPEEPVGGLDRGTLPGSGRNSRGVTRQSSNQDGVPRVDKALYEDNAPLKGNASRNEKPKRYGPRPVFWLDILQPTWEEMRVLSRAFGIHKLTAEDIMEQEAREKVELFRTYYFVNYRTFEQDDKSEDYMDPVNMYFVVFKGGVISFHFSQMPHPPNVRRRIRQLAEHQYTDSDWIAYAIIDNVTDAYAPLIEQIEKEVDDIDDDILQLNRDKPTDEKKQAKSIKGMQDESWEKVSEDDQPSSPDNDRDMLLRVGECRKRVMGLYRLLGSKADVIKGLAKRCNEQWEVAPKSDVGLYLGDIQDHIVTMTSNLTHYENILSRAHSNYLAQINIGMNERAEHTTDMLNKLTVLGTIVLPMNVVTGLWGMNCLVPGQVEDNPNLIWFFAIATFLVLFGLVCFFVTKRLYSI